MRNSLLALAAVTLTLAGCGGGGSGGLSGPQTGSAACSIDGQKSFVLETMRDVYFWNTLLPAQVDLAQFQTPEELLISLTSVQPLDRFSFINSAQADEDFFQRGELAAFGFSTTITDAGDVRFVRVFSGSPADLGGLARGQTLLAIDGRSVAEIQAAEGLSEAFGPPDVGVQRTLTVRQADNSEFDAVLIKAVVAIDPVPQVRTFTINNVNYGYIEFSTFVATAADQLDAAFADFNTLGITDIILDLRYNGGGLVSIAELTGDYLGGAVAQGQIFSETLFNDDNADANRTEFFERLTQSMSLSRLVVITTGGTASASELVINSMEPWVQVQLVGTTTFGKPVGQSGFEFCDKILRPTTFETVNGLGEGGYFDGLPVDCAAPDDLDFVVGEANEPSTAAALTLLSTGACPPATVSVGDGARIEAFRPPVGRTAAQTNAYVY